MQKSCRVSFMYGELTDKNTIDAIDEALETHQTEQFEILLYKKNRKSFLIILFALLKDSATFLLFLEWQPAASPFQRCRMVSFAVNMPISYFSFCQ